MGNERIVAAIGVTLELTSTEWSEMAMETAERLLAEHAEADVLGALGRCQREVRGRLRLADIVERLPRRLGPAGSLSDYQRGYRDGLFGKGRRDGEAPEWAAGYEAGVEEREGRRALAPPAQRHEAIRAGPRRVGTFKRPEIPAEVKALLPAPPTPASERQGAPVSADSAPGQGVGAGEPESGADGPESEMTPESEDDLLEIPSFLRRTPTVREAQKSA